MTKKLLSEKRFTLNFWDFVLKLKKVLFLPISQTVLMKQKPLKLSVEVLVHSYMSVSQMIFWLILKKTNCVAEIVEDNTTLKLFTTKKMAFTLNPFYPRTVIALTVVHPTLSMKATQFHSKRNLNATKLTKKNYLDSTIIM